MTIYSLDILLFLFGTRVLKSRDITLPTKIHAEGSGAGGAPPDLERGIAPLVPNRKRSMSRLYIVTLLI